MSIWMHMKAHCRAIHPPTSPHVSQGSVQNACKLKRSQFFHGLHTHQTCQPLSMFRMLWINVYDSVFQFTPISSNFTQPLIRIGTKSHRPQSTAWSTPCKGDVSRCMRQMVVTPDTDWCSDPHHLLFSFKVQYLWPTDAYLYSQLWNP